MVLAAVKKCYAIKDFCEKYRADREVVLAAVNKKDMNLEYASKELKNNPPMAQGSFNRDK